ncbi:hypothetical protein [Flavobacterium anhuiense]|uniref:hypothetical protein n=1 Tax=Flavobacterium anhuiense TaxID=459526 RepID=UPI000E6CEA40|nr:hypothetical protein [Flavobacterium anhuiense]
MKKLEKSIMFFLLFGTIIITASCNNEEIDTGQLTSQDTKIGKAKNWFDSYKSNSTTNKSEEGEINKAFGNLDYYWENAKVIKLDNNATGITVPVKDNPEDPEYKGQKMLYLYESDSKYQALLQEIFPESKDKIDDDQKKLGFNDLTLFSGYILNWDLKKGFLKGAKLKDGLVIGDVQNVITLLDEDIRNGTASKMIEMFDESANYGGERDDTLQKGGTAAIPLNNVIVVQKSPAPAPRDFSIAGAFSDGGSNGNSGTPTGGGSSGTTSTVAEISSIKSVSQLKATINNTDANAKDIKFVQNGNVIVSSATIGLLPWLDLMISVTQTKVGLKYVINNVVSNPIGVSTGVSWSQTAYGQVTNGNTTTITIVGLFSVNLFVEGLGSIVTTPVSYSVNIDNRNGKLISAKRLPL